MKHFFTLLFLFATSLGYSQFNYSVGAIPAALLNGANSVLLEKQMTVDVTRADRMLIKNHWAITVLNKRGNGHVLPYVRYDDSQKISHVEVFVYDAAGNEIEHFKKRDFTDRGLVDNVHFTVTIGH